MKITASIDIISLINGEKKSYKAIVFMNYYSGCGHFMKHISYKWNKNTLVSMYIISICNSMGRSEIWDKFHEL